MDSVLWLITAILMVFNCHASKKLPVFQRIPKRTLYYKTHVNVILKVQRNNDHTLKTKSVCDWFFIILYCVVSKHCRKSDPVYMIWLRTLMMYTLKHTMRWIIHTLKTVYTLKTLYVVIAVMYTYVQTMTMHVEIFFENPSWLHYTLQWQQLRWICLETLWHDFLRYHWLW